MKVMTPLIFGLLGICISCSLLLNGTILIGAPLLALSCLAAAFGIIGLTFRKALPQEWIS